MALSREEIQQLSDAIGKAISKSSSMRVENNTSNQDKIAKAAAEDRDSILKEGKKLADEMKKRTTSEEKLAKKTDKYASNSQKAFDAMANALKGPEPSMFDKMADNLAGVKELPDHFKAAMTANAPGLDNFIGELKNMEDVAGAQATLHNLQNVAPVFEQFATGGSTIEEATAHIDALGFTFKQTDEIMSAFQNLQTDNNGRVVANSRNLAVASGTLKGFDKVTDVAADTLRDYTDSVESATERQHRITQAGGKLKNVFASLTGAGAMLLGTLQQSAKFGAQLDIVGANLRGLQMGEWAETLAQSRQSVLALSGGLNEFESIVSAGAAVSLTAFTGDLGESTKGLAEMVQTSRLLGDANVDSAGFVSEQASTFKRLHNTLAMTIQDFSQLNKELVNDTDIRGIMMRMSGQERTAKFKQLQQDYEYYRSQGLLHEQATALAKTMDRMAGKDPRERMKEAARMNAVMTAMGMSTKDAGRAQELIVKGGRRSKGESTELAELTAATNKLVQSKKGESFEGEIFASALVDRAGIGDRLGSTDDLILAEGAKADKNVKAQMAQQNSLANKILGPVGMIQTFLSPTGPIGAAILATAAILGTTILAGLGTIATALAPLALPVIAISAAISGIYAIISSIFGGSGDNFIYQGFSKAFPEMSTIIGGTISEAMSGITSWFDDDDSDKKDKERKKQEQDDINRQNTRDNTLGSHLETLNRTMMAGNDIAKQGNTKLDKGVDETAKGNELMKKQGQTEQIKLRQIAHRARFNPVPNGA